MNLRLLFLLKARLVDKPILSNHLLVY